MAGCNCEAGWFGKNCEVDVDECLIRGDHGQLVCGNYGTCVNEPGLYFSFLLYRLEFSRVFLNIF